MKNKRNLKFKTKVIIGFNFIMCCTLGLLASVFFSFYKEQCAINNELYFILKLVAGAYFFLSVFAFIKYVYLPITYDINKEYLNKRKKIKELKKQKIKESNKNNPYDMK